MFAGVVERARLESEWTGNSLVGSNPTISAKSRVGRKSCSWHPENWPSGKAHASKACESERMRGFESYILRQEGPPLVKRAALKASGVKALASSNLAPSSNTV